MNIQGVERLCAAILMPVVMLLAGCTSSERHAASDIADHGSQPSMADSRYGHIADRLYARLRVFDERRDQISRMRDSVLQQLSASDGIQPKEAVLLAEMLFLNMVMLQEMSTNLLYDCANVLSAKSVNRDESLLKSYYSIQYGYSGSQANRHSDAFWKALEREGVRDHVNMITLYLRKHSQNAMSDLEFLGGIIYGCIYEIRPGEEYQRRLGDKNMTKDAAGPHP